MGVTYIETKNPRHIRNRIVYTFIAEVLLCVAFLSMVYYTYQRAEDTAFENLHMKTKEIKDDISLQMFSDRENLVTIANIAANLYNEGKSYDMLFKSFKSIGLIENIGILTSDNKFLTRLGEYEPGNEISFEEEAKKAISITRCEQI